MVSLLWLWVLVIVGFFSLSAGKQDLYIFPIVPAVAALAGCVLVRAVADRHAPAYVRAGVSVTLAAIGAMLLAIGVGLIYMVRTAGEAYAIAGLALAGGIGMLSGAAAIWLAARRSVAGSAVAIAAGLVAINAVFVLRTLPSFEAYKPVPGFAAAISGRAAPADIVATYEQALPSLVFYLRRHVEELFDPADLARVLGSGRNVYAVMSSDDYERVRAAAPAPLCVIDRRPTFDVRLNNVLARKPMPELVLVTNRCEPASGDR